MRFRAVATLVGALILFSMAMRPTNQANVLGWIVAVLIFPLAAAKILSVLSPRRLVEGLRYIAAGVFLFLGVRSWMEAGTPLTFEATFGLVGGLAIGLLPGVERDIRKWMYGVLLAVWGIVSLRLPIFYGGLVDAPFGSDYACGLVWIGFLIWWTSQRNPLVLPAHAANRLARKAMRWLDTTMVRIPKGSCLQDAILFFLLSCRKPIRSDADFERFRALCRRFRATPLAYKLVYSVAIAHARFEEAVQIALEAAEHGHGRWFGRYEIRYPLQLQREIRLSKSAQGLVVPPVAPENSAAWSPSLRWEAWDDTYDFLRKRLIAGGASRSEWSAYIKNRSGLWMRT